VIAWRRNWVGSSSPLSSKSQATGRPLLATHSLNSVVLPKLAGADDEADASHRGELAIQTRVQLLNKARARHRPWPDRRDVEFGL
jgi:hypothetical protein